MTTDMEKEIIDSLSGRIWVINNQMIKDYPPYNLANQIKCSRKMNRIELKRYIRTLTNWYPDIRRHYHVSDYREMSKISFCMDDV